MILIYIIIGIIIGYGIFVFLNKEKFFNSKCNHINDLKKILDSINEKEKIKNNDI